MNGMTIRQIADICKVDLSTVKKWIKKGNSEIFTKIGEKITKAFKTKKSALFTLEETISIVRAGGNNTLADLLLENAKQTDRNARVTRLPNGKQLEEMRRIYGASEAGRRIDFAMGFSSHYAPVTPEQARAGFRMIKQRLEDQSKQHGLFDN